MKGYRDLDQPFDRVVSVGMFEHVGWKNYRTFMRVVHRCLTPEGLFILEDWHSLGLYYDQTLMAWYDNFRKGWEAVRDEYDPHFYRMWCYYLLSCAAGFRTRRNQLWQIVFSKDGIKHVFDAR